MRENDLLLENISKIVIYIILTFGFYIFFNGHNAPGVDLSVDSYLVQHLF